MGKCCSRYTRLVSSVCVCSYLHCVCVFVPSSSVFPFIPSSHVCTCLQCVCAWCIRSGDIPAPPPLNPFLFLEPVTEDEPEVPPPKPQQPPPKQEKPPKKASKGKAGKAGKAVKSGKANLWLEGKSEDGHVYYYHSETGGESISLRGPEGR